MATDLFTNLASTTVTAGGTTAPAAGTVETWTVASSATFPAAVAAVSQFRVQEDDVTRQSEISLVTNVSGTTWTVTRGVEGTTPVAHPGNFAVVSTITAGLLTMFAGSLASVVTKTGAYTALYGDYVLADATAGPLTITLPASVVNNAGVVTVQKIDSTSNVVTIAGTVNGQTNATISAQFAGGVFRPTGTAWAVEAFSGGLVAATPATVPGAPTIGTATAGNASASVAFTAPASNGGSAITSYTATSTPGGLTGTAAASPVTVSGLTNGTAYTFTVTATNVAGTGPASAASNSVTPAAAALPGQGTLITHDTFTGTNGTLLAAHPANTAQTWAVINATADFVLNGSGKVTMPASGSNVEHDDVITCGQANMLLDTTITTSTGRTNIGVIGRVVDINNFVLGSINLPVSPTFASVDIYVKNASAFNTPTNLTFGVNITPGSTHRFSMKIFGAVVTFFFDGTSVGTYTLTAGEQTATNAGFKAGLRGTTGPTLDDGTTTIGPFDIYAATS